LDHYTILGVNPQSTVAEIKLAYRKKASYWHPDKNAHRLQRATEMMSLINKAYEILLELAKLREKSRQEKSNKAPTPRRRPSTHSNTQKEAQASPKAKSTGQTRRFNPSDPCKVCHGYGRITLDGYKRARTCPKCMGIGST
jgi:DnaJ-class molecular chaperone